MPNVLTINGGSSSIRFAIFQSGRPPRALLRGKMERIGSDAATLSIDQSAVKSGAEGNAAEPTAHLDVANLDTANLDARAKGGDHRTAVEFLMGWLEAHPLFATIGAVGHRVVHGMLHAEPQRVTAKLLDELKAIIPFDPEHLPREIELIEMFRERHAQLAQVVCFDTAFHRSMPRVATQLPIPRRLGTKGVQRYGFHGLSYTFLLEELVRLGDPAAVEGRVILAHLGSGASLAAVRNGKSVDTSMGFTPTAGLVMGTRSGDLDPGLMSYLASTDGMSAAQFQTMVNHESGLLGISETSADVRDLLARESSDARAAEAIDLFCYQARKWIGSFAAVLGGLDTLVFAGGIGENSAPIRRRICEGMHFLGIEIDGPLNDRHAERISTQAGSVCVRVIRTDEESVIANLSSRLLELNQTQET